MIDVKQTGQGDPMRFEVEVTSGGTSTRHQVTMTAADFKRLGGGHSPDELINAAFRFLLDREPKESILRSFDLIAIGTYFPEFEKKLPACFSSER